MSGQNAIDLLPLTDFPTEQDASDPGFESLFNDLVGDAATPADGFDDDVQIASNLLDQLDGALDGLSGQTGGTLDDTFAEILTVDPGPAGDDMANLAAAIPDTEGHIDNLGNLIAGATLPAPPQPGTGGMTVQTATSPVLPCNGSQGFGAGAGCGSYPCVALVPFTNNSGQNQTISSITLIQQPGGPWTVTTDLTPSFPAGASGNLKITATRAPQANETAQVQILIQGFPTPLVFCMDAGTGGTTGGGSGGGGGLKLQPAS